MADEIDQSGIAERVYGAVEALVASSALPLGCEYEYLPTERAELPCISVQTLNGAPVEKRYLDGSYVAAYRFALVLRQESDDTRERLDSTKILRELAAAVRSLADPTTRTTLDLGSEARLWSISADTLPARVQAQQGCTDYQVTLAVKYKQQR